MVSNTLVAGYNILHALLILVFVLTPEGRGRGWDLSGTRHYDTNWELGKLTPLLPLISTMVQPTNFGDPPPICVIYSDINTKTVPLDY